MKFEENKLLRMLTLLALVAAGLILIVTGQTIIGAPGLGRMLLGIVLLLAALYLYNRPYRD